MPMYKGPAQTCTVRYHSHDWDLLVETGWITVLVDRAGIAHMARGKGWTC